MPATHPPRGDMTRIEVPEGSVVLVPLFGAQDIHKRLLERELNVHLSARGTTITLQGMPSELSFAERVIQELIALVRSGAPLFLKDVERSIHLLREGSAEKLDELHGQSVLTTKDMRSITPKTQNQKRYLDAMSESDLVFAVGPAGTGKTYLAMAQALSALKRHEVKRIILTRPAIEAGERLGFLPGSLVEKVNPYLRPLYDALFDFVGVEQTTRLLDDQILEVAPLAFMRGRTLNQAFVILDEAQNTTKEQMKMFLTRLGPSSKAVVTGDMSQVDLPQNIESGLRHAVRLLQHIEAIRVVELTSMDVVRHPLVQAIVRAYDEEAKRLSNERSVHRPHDRS